MSDLSICGVDRQRLYVLLVMLTMVLCAFAASGQPALPPVAKMLAVARPVRPPTIISLTNRCNASAGADHYLFAISTNGGLGWQFSTNAPTTNAVLRVPSLGAYLVSVQAERTISNIQDLVNGVTNRTYTYISAATIIAVQKVSTNQIKALISSPSQPTNFVMQTPFPASEFFRLAFTFDGTNWQGQWQGTISLSPTKWFALPPPNGFTLPGSYVLTNTLTIGIAGTKAVLHSNIYVFTNYVSQTDTIFTWWNQSPVTAAATNSTVAMQ